MRCGAVENSSSLGVDEVPVTAASDEEQARKIFELARNPLGNPDGDDVWVFRGCQSPHWALAPSIERHADKTTTSSKRSMLEWILVREFQRGAHHYLDRVPSTDLVVEWLALMRHFGAPTRLLDWSYSFYVALFFAYEQVSLSNLAKCPWVSVWALNTTWLDRRFKAMASKEHQTRSNDPNFQLPQTFGKVFSSRRKYVLPVSAFESNVRVIAQRGTFTCASDVDDLFENNLHAMLDGTDLRSVVRRFDLPANAVARVLQTLRRMNITRATIYPGLAGLAESLQNIVYFPELLKGPITDREYRLGRDDTRGRVDRRRSALRAVARPEGQLRDRRRWK